MNLYEFDLTVVPFFIVVLHTKLVRNSSFGEDCEIVRR